MEVQRKSRRKVRRRLPLEERVQVLYDFKDTPDLEKLADKYKCSSHQIKYIVNHKESILVLYEKSKKKPQRSVMGKFKILTVEERIQIIRDFKRNPIYQRLSSKYKCSSAQIKSIVKKGVVSFFRTKQDELLYQRRKKLILLNKVILEYIERAVFHNKDITEDTVRLKMYEVAIALSITLPVGDSFKKLLQNFKKNFSIGSFEADTLKKNIKIYGPKLNSFNTISLIKDVVQNERERKNTRKQQENERNNCEKIENTNDDDTVSIYYESECESDHNNDHFEVESESTTGPALPEVVCYEETLLHLKYLEDFAMLTENYRAISVITRLEEALQTPPLNEESDDIESNKDEDYVTVILRSDKESDEEVASSSEIMNCYKEATRHLTILEDFAMLQDNYRVIGLLAQLERVIKS